MKDYDSLLEDVAKTASQIKVLFDLAYRQYALLVDEVLSNNLTNEQQIERILDGLFDFGDDLRFLELSKKLCHYVYDHYPKLVGNDDALFRMMFEERSDRSDAHSIRGGL